MNDYCLLRQTQLSYERELGMTPASRMALRLSGTRAVFDLPGAMANADIETVGAEAEQRAQEREKQRGGFGIDE